MRTSHKIATLFLVLVGLSFNLTASETGDVVEVVSASKGVGGKAPDFSWKQNGKVVNFSQYTKGKIVLLNIWATWCGPCKREIPDLIEISKEMESKGVIVVGVSVDQHASRLKMVTNYVEKAGINYITIVDDLKIAEVYGPIKAIPTTFIIDRDGKIIQKIVGMQSKQQFLDALKRAE
jgi:thiol-disulfide isomerase/thioredoxin